MGTYDIRWSRDSFLDLGRDHRGNDGVRWWQLGSYNDIEIGLFSTVTVWLVPGENSVLAALLGSGAIIHYTSRLPDSRWLLAH